MIYNVYPNVSLREYVQYVIIVCMHVLYVCERWIEIRASQVSLICINDKFISKALQSVEHGNLYT